MPNQFGGPTPTSSFLTGLGSSFMNQLVQQHEAAQQEEKDKKMMDYTILMKAMEAMHDQLTPSQVGEILSRGVDIFKPKGHGGIKENIKEMFGKQPQYQMQGGNILKQVMAEPRKQVGTEQVLPLSPSVRPSNIQLPEPPSPQITQEGGTKPIYEQTYEEKGIEDEIRKQDLMLQRQLAMENQREKDRQADIKARSDEARKTALYKVTQLLPQELKAKAPQKLEQQAAIIAAGSGRSMDDPEVLKEAAVQIQYEAQQRKELNIAKLEHYKVQNDAIQKNLQLAQERIEMTRQRLQLSKHTDILKNAQVMKAQKQINSFVNEAQRTRVLAGQAWGQYAASGDEHWKDNAEALEKQAEGFDEAAQKKTDYMESYVNWLGGESRKPAEGGSGVKKKENPDIRAYADKYFNGDYAAAEAASKAKQ